MGSTVTDRIAGVSTSVAIKAPVKAITQSNISLSGLGVQAGGSWTEALAAGDRVLVKDQTDAKENGVYTAFTSEWRRASDFNGYRDVVKGTSVPIESTGDRYRVISDNPIIIGSTEINFQLHPQDARVIPVTSRTAMKTYDVPPGTQFSLEEGGRSGTFVVKSGAPPSDPQEGIYVVLDNGNYAMRRFDGVSSEAGVYGSWWGVTAGASEDNTTALQAAIDYAGSLAIILPQGEIRYTETLNFDRNTKIVGPRGDGGLFAGYSSYLNYAPGSAVKTTLNGAIDSSQTTITLTSTTSISAGSVVYLDGVNGEYIKVGAVSGNDITGCTRDFGGGTVEGTTYPDGTTVWLNRPAIQRQDNSFSGGLIDVALYHDGFVDEATGWDDLGVGLYFPQASYAHVVDNALVYGFEKAGFFGQGFLTTLTRPMVYRCRYGYQIDTGNGATLSDVDMGVMGNAASGTGWGLYFKGGNGGSVHGGNLSNGGVNIPVISDSHQELMVSGTYSEATSNDMFYALNDGSIFVDGHYGKGATSLGRVATGGKLFIDGMEYENITNKRVLVSAGETGRWSLKNTIDIDDSYARQSDQYGIDDKRYTVPSWDAADSAALCPRVYHSKAITDNTLTDVLKFRTEPVGTDPDITVGATINYTYGTDRDGGQAAEHGQVHLIIKHRTNNAPSVSIVKQSSVQALDSATMSITWSQTTTQISGDRYEVTVEITAAESLGNNGELTVIVESSLPPFRSDDLGYGFLTLL